ncbi:MAG: MlaD family protein, partial [Gammaproteobacteria bacterium]|nr:MlaD family protein [Gammaproteobacteria bacterium]
MDENTNFLAVGSFILLGAIALLAVGVWVGGAGQTESTSRYTILFVRDVNGLSEGSPVRYLGVDVGQVDAISLSPSNPMAVEVEIDIAQSTPVNSSTYASLAYQGITGVAFINLGSEPG